MRHPLPRSDLRRVQCRHPGRLGDFRERDPASPGRTFLRYGRAELVAVDPPKYGLGYLLDMNECGRGVATEAVRSLVEYAFDSLGATDVFAGVTHGNERSVTLLQRLGFDRVAQFESYDRFHLGASG
jgi:RimJ/RimL family protein N-acetyltransferase